MPSLPPLALGVCSWRLQVRTIPDLSGLVDLPGLPDRGGHALLDTVAKAGRIAADEGVILAFETGQERATLLRRTLDDLKAPNLKVNFDPANMILYDMGDPIEAVEILAGDIRS